MHLTYIINKKNKMRNPYYLVWADSIYRIKKYKPNEKNWGIIIFIINTTINALNFWTIVIWLKIFNIYNLPLIYIDLFPGHLLNESLSFFVEFAFPFIIVNYSLVFYKNKYKKIVEMYPNPQKKYAFYYSVISLSIAFISGILQ